MSRRDRRRQRRESGTPPNTQIQITPAAAPHRRSERGESEPARVNELVVAKATAAAGEVPWFRDPWVWLLAGAACAVVSFSVYKFWPPAATNDSPPDIVAAGAFGPPDHPKPAHPKQGEAFGHKTGAKSAAEPADDFLSEFTQKDPEADKASGAGDLEKQFHALMEANDQFVALKKRGAAGANVDDEELQRVKEARDEFDRQAIALEKELAKARQARPKDPVPRWLTGELLILIGGEPEEIGPHLEYALAQGLKRPRLAGSLALNLLEANRFADAYRTAGAALEQNSQDRYLWSAFAQAAIDSNQFQPLLDRLTRAFPAGLPAWAKMYQRKAEILQAKWETEQQIRQAEGHANILPRVRLVIEHRRFAKDRSGNPLTTVETTGRGEIVLELFENEAPLTVANFLALVTKKFYDGTTFHLALPATMVAGGDPNTRNDDPDDDGAGGPGYAILDEFKAKDARNHFRGSLSMVRSPEQPAGSQFFINLAPSPAMDGQFTVFGRILEGQDVADRITRGRTTRRLGHFGRIIPGDLLVCAEVVRKRPSRN